MQEVEHFITRWQNSGAAERSNYALFLSELCDLLGVSRPSPSSEYNQLNDYVIDRAFTRNDKDSHSSTIYLDLYKRGHFVLETKQGSSGSGDKLGHGKRGTQGWDKALDKAYHQARAYIRDLPADHGRPPFLIVVDVGHCFDLYAEFTGTGGTYLAFPAPASRRIFLEDLRNPEIRELLHKIWTDPHSLDPSKYAAKVTREVADTLAALAASLEKDGHDPQIIATFLQRLLFTLFAEDVELLPKKSFENLLITTAQNPAGFTPLITALWKDMASGTDFSTVLLQKVIHFNGGLFENPTALPLRKEQIELLIAAASKDWKEVEPAIFGTLLERALDPRERHKLGAHYTPRSYVERLIEPTLMQPLREQWSAVKTAAALLHDQAESLHAGSADTQKLHKQSRDEIQKFHRYLCDVKVLDPACGSGNFLYIALARIKELEAEVLDLLDELEGDLALEMDLAKVRPSQFLGIEVNPRAAAIAQIVLWIGYFQWHHKTTGKADTNDRPLLRSENTIENRDAVLAYDQKIPRRHPDTGAFLTIWDGTTTKPHPVTGKEVPDESARKPLFDYIKPRRTTWPKADYIIGNPPFLGASRMRDGLGDGYVEALRLAWKSHKPNSWDFVMFWWHQAAELVRDKKAISFGFITTNSIHQTFNRRCLEPFLSEDKKPISITFAIPDHPWIDAANCAAVRIAMTVAKYGRVEGKIHEVYDEEENEEGEHMVEMEVQGGKIAANLKIGADTSSTSELIANEELCNRGFCLFGSGFIVDKEEAAKLLKSSRISAKSIIHDYWNGRDLTSSPRNLKVIDAYGLSAEELALEHPAIYQHILTTVKPERDNNKRESRKKFWWIFGEPNKKLREQLACLPRYITTVETSKHRFFTFLDQSILPDNKLINIAINDASLLAVLSSSIHVSWALSIGSQLGQTPVYVKTTCFETFPFPDLDDKPELKQRLRDLGERLDSHRKSRQAEHPDLTLTGMYNVLEKLRAEEPLTDKERNIHDDGLVTLLKQIHDEIDEAVFEAYGWQDILIAQQVLPNLYDFETGTTALVDLDPEHFAAHMRECREYIEQEMLRRLVKLNHERAAEEALGKIRYLRPEFQDPKGSQKQIEQSLALPEATAKAAIVTAKIGKPKWPTTLPEKVALIQSLIPETGLDPAALDLTFGRTSKTRQSEIQQILLTLQALGKI